MTTEFQVGDTVEIVDPEWCYNSYQEFADLHALRRWTCGALPKDGSQGRVVAKLAHLGKPSMMVYVVECDEEEFIMHGSGLEKIESSVPFKLEPFMRVELHNGDRCVVTERHSKDDLVLAFFQGGWVEAEFSESYFGIHKVYAAPSYYDRFNPYSETRLLYRYESPTRKRIEALEKELEQLRKELDEQQ